MTDVELWKMIEEIENSNFDFDSDNNLFEEMHTSQLLRKASICYSEIKKKKEKNKLTTTLNSILINKIKKINPNLNNRIIAKIILGCKLGKNYCPSNIYVLDDIVFFKEIVYDNNKPYKIENFIGHNSYFDVYDNMDFVYYDTIAKPKLNKEECKKLSLFISNNINDVLRKKHNTDIVKPLYELNNKRFHYGYAGITADSFYHMDIFLNKSFLSIAESMIKKKECDIKMFVHEKDFFSEDEFKDKFYLYTFHQSFKDNIIIWTSEESKEKVWRLREETIKQEKRKEKQKTKKKGKF